jgi:hypothetical protein
MSKATRIGNIDLAEGRLRARCIATGRSLAFRAFSSLMCRFAADMRVSGDFCGRRLRLAGHLRLRLRLSRIA